MRSAWKSAPGGAVLMALSVLWTACQSDTTAPRTDLSGTNATAAVSTNGAGNQMPAFYEGDVFTVNMKEMPLNASASTIAHNGNLNEIFATNDLDDEQDFLPVIDAIPGGDEGFNPLWHQNLIVYNPGVTPHQFTSEDEVLAAAAGPNPEITIVETDEVYRCSVVGQKQ